MNKEIPVITMAGDKERSLQFEITTMGFIDDNRHSRIDHPHKHDYFVIIWVKNGVGRHMVDFHEFKLNNDSILFLTPGQIHQLETTQVPEGYVISFHDDFFGVSENQRELLLQTGLFFNCSQFTPHRVDSQQAAVLGNLIAMMQKEVTESGYMHYESLRGLLQLFLIHCSRFWGQMNNDLPQSAKPAWLTRRFLNLLEKNFKKMTKVRDYASLLVITPNHLNETIKTTTGFPASDHIKKRVVLEAKRLAVLENSTAKEIAYSLGFEDEAHFSKYFKNNSGSTFSQFRAGLRDI